MLRYLMFGHPDWDRRQHLVDEDNQPICGARTVTADMLSSRRALVHDKPYDPRTVCWQCTRAKAAYLERKKLEAWNSGC